jgi:hypothetical protein
MVRLTWPSVAVGWLKTDRGCSWKRFRKILKMSFGKGIKVFNSTADLTVLNHIHIIDADNNKWV